MIAEALGTPFMPWQRQVIDTIMEIDPATGRLAYREWRVTVPRQSGKTTLILPKLVYRCLGPLGRRQRVVYTAQTHKDAKKKWETEHVEQLRDCPVFDERTPLNPGGMYTVRLAAGSERLTWHGTDSIHSIDASTEKAGHGGTLDEAIIDEAFARPDWAVEQSMRPAMVTRANAQLGITSTAGASKVKSPYLWAKVEDGRARAEAGQTKGIAYFEWSAGEDIDLNDPTMWWSFMPALGHTITPEAIEADREGLANQPGEFDRAYGNRWPGAATVIQAIPAESWEACRDPDASIEGRWVWGVDVSPERNWAAIAAAGYTSTGRELIENVDYRAGPPTWVVPRLLELAERHNNWIVGLDASGPAGALIPALESAGSEWSGFTVLKASQQDKAKACGALFDAAVSADAQGAADRLVHRGQMELDVALSAAEKYRIGDTWLWSRGASLGDISVLYAVTIARWALTTSEDPWVNVLDSIA